MAEPPLSDTSVQPAQALADLNVALAFRPDHTGARYWRGWLHQKQRRWQYALTG